MHPLKEWRLKNKISQRVLASEIKEHQETISRFESGARCPSLAIAVAIERYTRGAVTARMLAEWQTEEREPVILGAEVIPQEVSHE